MKKKHISIGKYFRQSFLVLCLFFVFFQNTHAENSPKNVMHPQGFFQDIFKGGDPKKMADSTMEEIEEITGLPNPTFNEFIASVVTVILMIFSVLLTITALWSGTLFLIQFGDEERVTKAKQLLIWSLVGVAATAVSYAFVSGIINLDFSNG